MKENRTQQRRIWIGLSVFSAVLLAAILLFQPRNWAQQQTSSFLDAANVQPSTPVEPAKPLMLDADLIRVGITNDGMEDTEYPYATLSATGPFRIRVKNTDTVILEGKPHQLVQISRNGGGFYLASNGHATVGPIGAVLQVEPTVPESRLKIPSITRKGKIPTYRGIFELVPEYNGSGQFTVVNVLPIQEYLKAVVPNELPFRYGYEAVKAQAVAARNYAIRPRERPWSQFDICDSQYCQAYYGENTEHPQTTRAIQETHGLIALYQGEPVLALYSSSHGGYSENYENAFSDPKTHRFPATPLPYLKGGPDVEPPLDLTQEENARAFYTKRPESYDIESPNYRWQKQWTRPALEAIINRNLAAVSRDGSTRPFVSPAFAPGQRIGTLKAITITQRGVSGKAMHVNIVGTNGTWRVSKEFVIRKVLQHNGRFLPSANVILQPMTNRNGQLVGMKAIGGGFGHGVGMSQLGASYLSKRGKPFVHILQHYYKGAALGTVPLTARANQGMKTTVYVVEPKGKVYLEGPPNAPVQFAVNDQAYQKTLDATGKATIAVDPQHFKLDTLNTFKLYPLAAEAPHHIKGWLELYPAQGL